MSFAALRHHYACCGDSAVVDRRSVDAVDTLRDLIRSDDLSVNPADCKWLKAALSVFFPIRCFPFDILLQAKNDSIDFCSLRLVWITIGLHGTKSRAWCETSWQLVLKLAAKTKSNWVYLDFNAWQPDHRNVMVPFSPPEQSADVFPIRRIHSNHSLSV